MPALAALTASPALAQSSADDEAFQADLERQERLDESVLVVDRMIDAVLDMPVGALTDALPPETADLARVTPRDTLRDLGTRHDPAFEENFRGGARAMTAVIGSMMQQFQTALPALERWGEDVGEAHPD